MHVEPSWSWEPGVLAALAVYLGIYVVRWRRARREAGARGASAWRLAAFAGGILTLFAALVSPVDALGEQVFAMHMLQHVLLLDIAPILLILGLTKVLLRPVTRRVTRLERAAGPLAHPVFAAVAYIAVMFAWHVPGAYDAALSNDGIHALEHVSFTAAGLLYWWHLLSPIRSRMRLGGMGPIVYMGGTKLFVGALGIALTFYPHALYDFYAGHYPVWGMGADTDQAVAGMVMALEQSIVMGVAIVVLFARMLIESEREEQRRERLEDLEEERAAAAAAAAGAAAQPAATRPNTT